MDGQGDGLGEAAPPSHAAAAALMKIEVNRTRFMAGSLREVARFCSREREGRGRPGAHVEESSEPARRCREPAFARGGAVGSCGSVPERDLLPVPGCGADRGLVFLAVDWRGAIRRWAANPEARRKARTRLLVAMLTLSLAALIVDRGTDYWFDPRPKNPADHVVVYTTRWCPVCERLRQCLRKNGVPFEERDVEASWRARAEWAALDGYGVPLTLAGREIAYGMRQAQLQTALAKAGYRVDCWSAAGSAALSESAVPGASR